MKKITTLILIIIFVNLFTGCPKTIPNKQVVDSIVKTYKTQFTKDQIRYNCYVRGLGVNERFDMKEPSKIKESSETIDEDVSCKTDGVDKPKYAADARRIRDDVASRFIRVIDNNYEQFANDLQNNRATTNFLGDVTELGVGTAIGITNGERVLQILGVALTAFRGGRKSISQNFYEQQSTPILLIKMDTSRDRVMSAILQKRQKFGVDKYSLEDSLGDVVKYFWSGTLMRAFVELSKDTSVQAKEAESKLFRIEGVEIEGVSSDESLKISDDIFEQRKSLSDQFKEAELIEEDSKKADAIKKVVDKYIKTWKDVEENKAFSKIVEQLLIKEEYKATINKINNSETPPTKVEVNRLFKDLISFISAADDKAGTIKLQELFLQFIKKANQ